MFPMLAAILITLLIGVALGGALRAGRGDGLIANHTYNNRYSDATAARDDHLG
jgi:hypothetical protein